MPVVTGIDVLGIQRYVFASNRLRDVLAASWMVDHVTGEKSLMQWGLPANQVLRAAAGNAIIEFETIEQAREWTSRYTRWLQDKAPGIGVAVAHRSYEDGSLACALKALAVDVARTKFERRPSAAQLGLSVTAVCSVTGLPANALDHYGDLVSSGVYRLRDEGTQKEAKKRWDSFRPQLPNAAGWQADFPDELDLMGRTERTTSLLGVVHVDGNSIGKAINGWIGRCIDEQSDDVRVGDEYREWSHKIDELGRSVLQALTSRAASRVENIEMPNAIAGQPRWERRCWLRGTPSEIDFKMHDWRHDTTRKARRGTVFLPLRPILLGGDDLTFVCDGRIALDLATSALREFAKHSVPHLGKDGGETTFTACAGVALVKAHAPFYRGYQLADDLCRSAKQARHRANKVKGIETGCWLDWHVGPIRPGEKLNRLRARQYQDGNLTMRPYPLVRYNGREESWNWLDRELLGPAHSPNDSFRGFRKTGDDESEATQRFANSWAGSRNRVKRLGSLVVEGKDAVNDQINAWSATESGLRLPLALANGGFIGDQTPILDAIELMDLHVRLETDPQLQAAPTDQVVSEGTT
jgi:hypothetical protein